MALSAVHATPIRYEPAGNDIVANEIGGSPEMRPTGLSDGFLLETGLPDDAEKSADTNAPATGFGPLPKVRADMFTDDDTMYVSQRYDGVVKAVPWQAAPAGSTIANVVALPPLVIGPIGAVVAFNCTAPAFSAVAATAVPGKPAVRPSTSIAADPSVPSMAAHRATRSRV